MDINRTNASGIYGFHTGAYVAMSDGRVSLKVEGTDPGVMAAHFSRDGGRDEAQLLGQQSMRITEYRLLQQRGVKGSLPNSPVN